MLQVQVANGVEGLALFGRRGSMRGTQIENGIAIPPKWHTLVSARKEAAPPVNRATTRAARTGQENDEPRKSLRFAADAVGDPCAHAGPAKLAGTGVHEKFGRRVIEEISGARFHQ